MNRGVRELLPRQRKFRSTLREQRLTVPDLFDSILIPALCNFESRIGRIIIRLRHNSLLYQSHRAIATQARLVELRFSLPDSSCLFRADAIVSAVWRKSQTRARLA